jgi:hypothetical protein
MHTGDLRASTQVSRYLLHLGNTLLAKWLQGQGTGGCGGRSWQTVAQAMQEVVWQGRQVGLLTRLLRLAAGSLAKQGQQVGWQLWPEVVVKVSGQFVHAGRWLLSAALRLAGSLFRLAGSLCRLAGRTRP